MSVILAYVYYFIASSGSSLQRRHLAKRRDHDMTSNDQISFAFSSVLFVTAGSFLLVFLEAPYFTGNPVKIITLAVLSGLFGLGFFIYSYKSVRHVDAGVSTLVSNIYTPVSIILSIIFLHEGLTAQQIIGTILLLLAMFIVSKKHRIGKFKFDKYLLMILFSGLCLGFLLVCERAMQKTTGFTMGTILSWSTQCLFLGIATLVYKSKHTYTNKEVITTGVFKFLQSSSWVVLIFLVGNLSIVSSITTFKVVIMFIAGAIFLGEKDDIGRKILGSIIAVIGLLLMK